jgi:hypothetical protein
METSRSAVCSHLMENEPGADWSDLAIAAIVAVVTLGIPLFFLFFP